MRLLNVFDELIVGAVGEIFFQLVSRRPLNAAVFRHIRRHMLLFVSDSLRDGSIRVDDGKIFIDSLCSLLNLSIIVRRHCRSNGINSSGPHVMGR